MPPKHTRMSQILLFQFLLMIQLLAKASASSLDNLGGGGLIFRVEGGDLINADGTKTHVGFYTSQIQAQGAALEGRDWAL